MMRKQLEHIIRSASIIANDYEIVVVGSQSILGGHPHAPDALLFSMEADIYPKNQKEKSELIDGAIGEGSAFHVSYGYYAQGVGPDTAVLLSDWESRLNAIRLTNSVGYCLDAYDLAISKLAANREKDHNFVSLLLHFKLVEYQKLKTFAEQLIRENGKYSYVILSLQRRLQESEGLSLKPSFLGKAKP